LICTLALLSLFLSPAHAELMHFRVDRDATEIGASVDEPLSSVRPPAVGTFKVVSGEIYGDPANVRATGRVSIVIDAGSYQSSSSLRDHAVKAKVLEIERFGTIAFSSTAIEVPAVTSPQEGTIVGDLTLHGVTHRIRVPMKASIEPSGRMVVDGEISFNYDLWGIDTPTVTFGTLSAGNVARVKFHVVADRAR
jgi:polyisoprenoid-binding protein YceI